MSFIDKVIASEVLGTGFVDVTTTTSTTSTTTQAPALTMSFSPPVNGNDIPWVESAGCDYSFFITNRPRSRGLHG